MTTSKNSVHSLIKRFSNESNGSVVSEKIAGEVQREGSIDLHSLIDAKLKSMKDLGAPFKNYKSKVEIQNISLEQQISIIEGLTQQPSLQIKKLLLEFKLYFEARKSGYRNDAKIVDLNSKLDRLVQDVELMLASLQQISYLQKGFEVMKGKIKGLINAIFFIEKAAECIRYESKNDNKELLSEIDSLLETANESVSCEEPQRASLTSVTNRQSHKLSTESEKPPPIKRTPMYTNSNYNASLNNQESYTLFEIYEDKIIIKTKFANLNDKDEKSIILQYQINL